MHTDPNFIDFHAKKLLKQARAIFLIGFWTFGKLDSNLIQEKIDLYCTYWNTIVCQYENRTQFSKLSWHRISFEEILKQCSSLASLPVHARIE